MGFRGGNVQFVAYTPVLTSSGVAPVMLPANRIGRWRSDSDLVVVEFQLVWTALGAGEGLGTGTYSFSLPVAAAASYPTFACIGSASYRDSGTRLYDAVASLVTATTVWIEVDGGTGGVGAATPVVPANNDQYSATLTYEPA